jgi:hypothetical protein
MSRYFLVNSSGASTKKISSMFLLAGSPSRSRANMTYIAKGSHDSTKSDY